MRNIIDVIDQVIAVIPDKEQDFINELTNIQTSTSYAPPEIMLMWWQEIALILPSYFEKPTEEWHFEVLAIFADKTVEEIKKHLLADKKEA